MSDRERPKPPPSAPPPSAPEKPGSSGRVNFDDRGQAVWEWSVKTGMFDRNASTQRIRKLLDEPSGLEIVDYDASVQAEGGADAGSAAAAHSPASGGAKTGSGPGATHAKPTALPDRAGGFNPYERVERATPAQRRRESAGGDPYSSGSAKKPENVSFNPYERKPKK